ncbi:MAG: response regulator, partial [Myxococcota bacterium]
MSSVNIMSENPAQDATPSHCVFLVDDDEHLRRLVRRWLEVRGLDVFEFEDGESCVEALEERQPSAVLLDLHMPGAGGVSTLQRIKARHRFLPVVVLTSERD